MQTFAADCEPQAVDLATGSRELPRSVGALTWASASEVAPLAALEAHLILEAAVQERPALVVSGANRLDALALLARARARGLEAGVVDGTWVMRAFTVHQFATMIEEGAPKWTRQRASDARTPVGLVIVSGVLEPFLDEDVTPAEARVLFRRCIRTLTVWARAQAFPVVATACLNASPLNGGARNDTLADALSRLAQAHADVHALHFTPASRPLLSGNAALGGASSTITMPAASSLPTGTEQSRLSAFTSGGA